MFHLKSHGESCCIVNCFALRRMGLTTRNKVRNSCCDLFLRKVCLVQLLRRDIGKCGKRTEQP